MEQIRTNFILLFQKQWRMMVTTELMLNSRVSFVLLLVFVFLCNGFPNDLTQNRLPTQRIRSEMVIDLDPPKITTMATGERTNLDCPTIIGLFICSPSRACWEISAWIPSNRSRSWRTRSVSEATGLALRRALTRSRQLNEGVIFCGFFFVSGLSFVVSISDAMFS